MRISATSFLSVLALAGTSIVVESFVMPSAATAASVSSASRVSQPLSMSSEAAPSDVDSEMTLEDLKMTLVQCCQMSPKPSLSKVQGLVRELEVKAEMAGVGQSSSFSGMLSGEWELLFAPEDVTRSSPFFWAFQQAFPENSDQIFSITDSIPAPIKEVGPAFQNINFVTETGRGQFVSRVKVATLGGLATSIMTTRATIVGVDGVDGIKLKVETTKPEESSAIERIPLLGTVINQNAPPFPSGEALEKVKEGSSQVTMRTTFCDEGLRISRYDAKYDGVFVWRRREFASYEML